MTKLEEGLNQNPVLRALMLSLIDAGATAFVETGTCWGDTCLWIAKRRPSLPIYTCDIGNHAVSVAKKKFVGYDQIHQYQISSEKFIPDIAGQVGDLPLFYLDAHWTSYWPLLDELRAIAAHHHSAYIVIHDFQVPNVPEFCFIQDKGHELNVDYIRPVLSPLFTYTIFYPTRSIGSKPGFAVLFQNVDPVIYDQSELEEGVL